MYACAICLAAAAPAAASATSAVGVAGSSVNAVSAASSYATAAGISDAQAAVDLARQQEAGDIVSALQTALGPEYAGVWFAPTSGRVEVPLPAGVSGGPVSSVFGSRALSGDYDVLRRSARGRSF